MSRQSKKAGKKLAGAERREYLAYNPDEPRVESGPTAGEWTSGGGNNEPPVQGGKATYEMQKAQATAFLDKVESEDSTFSRWAGNVLSSMSNQPGGFEEANAIRLLQLYGREDIGRVVALMGRNVESSTIEKVLTAVKSVDDSEFAAPPDGNSAWTKSEFAGNGDITAIAFAMRQGWSAAEFEKYVGAAQSYNSSDYHQINGFLRNGSAPGQFDMGKITAFAALLKALPDIPVGTPLFRGLALKPDNPLAKMFLAGVGDFSDKGFVSSTTSEKYATSWAFERSDLNGGRIPFVLKFTHDGGGKNATPFFRLTTESEVTFGPGQRYRIVKTEKATRTYPDGTTNPYWLVHLKQVKP